MPAPSHVSHRDAPSTEEATKAPPAGTAHVVHHHGDNDGDDAAAVHAAAAAGGAVVMHEHSIFAYVSALSAFLQTMLSTASLRHGERGRRACHPL